MIEGGSRPGGTIRFLLGAGTERGGVADYARRLAAEIPKWDRGDVLARICFGVGALQLGSSGEAVSLQYVPHGFNAKGIPAKLPRQLGALTSGLRVQIMFHELWVGDRANSPTRHRVMRIWQQLIARSLVRYAAPVAVHTTNEYYRHRLAHIGIQATVLPLFTTVPIVDPHARPNYGDGHWRIGILGEFEPSLNLLSWLGNLENATAVRGDAVTFVFLGRPGRGIHWFERECRTRFPAARIERTGELDAEQLSLEVSRLHAGVATTPAHLLDKSSGCVVLMAHGLPIYAVEPGELHFAPPSPQIRVGIRAGDVLEHAELRFPARDTLTEVCTAFLSDLFWDPS